MPLKSEIERKEYQKKYRKKNREKLRVIRQKWVNKNREKDAAYEKKYRNNNRKKELTYYYARRKNDVGFRIKCNLRHRLNQALKGNTKSQKTLNLLGCPIEFLKQYLEA